MPLFCLSRWANMFDHSGEPIYSQGAAGRNEKANLAVPPLYMRHVRLPFRVTEDVIVCRNVLCSAFQIS